jgi:hypothetical protein
MKYLHNDNQLVLVVIEATKEKMSSLRKGEKYEVEDILSIIWKAIGASEHRSIGRLFSKLVSTGELPELIFCGISKSNRHNLYCLR